MKSTYRLLSIHLDRMPMPERIPDLVDLAKLDHIQAVSVEYNLFDLKGIRRYVKGSELLSSSGSQGIVNILDRIPWCESLYIMLDYTSRGAAAVALYVRRVLQAVRMLQDRFPQIEIALASEQDMVDDYLRVIRKIYEDE